MLPALLSLVDRLLLPDGLWQRIQPLLPAPPPCRRGGVLRRVPDRNCVAALVFMARTSTQWSLLPAKELGCGSATTCWRAWMSGPAPGCLISSRRCCWTSSLRPAAATWSESAWTPSACERSKGDLTGANPVDRGKQGSKLHLVSECGGLPLSVILSAANANDSTMFEAVLDDIPAMRMPTGRRRRRPVKAHGDKAYDHRRCRAYLRRRASARRSPAA
jgi:transposase